MYFRLYIDGLNSLRLKILRPAMDYNNLFRNCQDDARGDPKRHQKASLGCRHHPTTTTDDDADDDARHAT